MINQHSHPFGVSALTPFGEFGSDFDENFHKLYSTRNMFAYFCHKRTSKRINNERMAFLVSRRSGRVGKKQSGALKRVGKIPRVFFWEVNARTAPGRFSTVCIRLTPNRRTLLRFAFQRT